MQSRLSEKEILRLESKVKKFYRVFYYRDIDGEFGNKNNVLVTKVEIIESKDIKRNMQDAVNNYNIDGGLTRWDEGFVTSIDDLDFCEDEIDWTYDIFTELETVLDILKDNPLMDDFYMGKEKI